MVYGSSKKHSCFSAVSSHSREGLIPLFIPVLVTKPIYDILVGKSSSSSTAEKIRLEEEELKLVGEWFRKEIQNQCPSCSSESSIHSCVSIDIPQFCRRYWDKCFEESGVRSPTGEEGRRSVEQYLLSYLRPIREEEAEKVREWIEKELKKECLACGEFSKFFDDFNEHSCRSLANFKLCLSRNWERCFAQLGLSDFDDEYSEKMFKNYLEFTIFK
jgi:hypothetical protein